MPWTNTVEQRYQFVCECLRGTRSMAAICRQYGISRPVGYKWLARFKKSGRAGLEDRSRRPHSNPNVMSELVKETLLDMRRQDPTWGARKLRKLLRTHHPDLAVPAESTIGDLLRREGLVDEAISARRRRSKARGRTKRDRSLAPSEAPNDVWCMDYKGEFRLGDRSMCYPLTITDRYSRYVIACVAQTKISLVGVEQVLKTSFERFGLPRFVRTDNGTPFGGDGIQGYSYLSVQLIRRGIQPEHIDPGRPDQNGTHERMHRPLKAETTRPPARTLEAQQRVFDAWTHRYNHVRPHEGIGLETPSSLYLPSTRQLSAPSSPVYPGHFEVLKVKSKGHFRWKGCDVFVGAAFRGEPVGLEEIDDDVWLVSYGSQPLGVLQTPRGKKWHKLSPLGSWK